MDVVARRPGSVFVLFDKFELTLLGRFTHPAFVGDY